MSAVVTTADIIASKRFEASAVPSGGFGRSRLEEPRMADELPTPPAVSTRDAALGHVVDPQAWEANLRRSGVPASKPKDSVETEPDIPVAKIKGDGDPAIDGA